MTCVNDGREDRISADDRCWRDQKGNADRPQRYLYDNGMGGFRHGRGRVGVEHCLMRMYEGVRRGSGLLCPLKGGIFSF